MTKEDFVDWKQSAVTKEVFSSLKAQEERIIETLIADNGDKQDEWYKGYIAALRDVYLVTMEDFEDA